MLRRIATTIVLGLCLAAGDAARAAPVLGEPQAAGPLRVFADDADASTFYYPPGALRVAQAPGGGPDLRFLQLWYVGTDATGDANRFVARSVVSLRVEQVPVAAADLAAARAALPAGAKLRALPLRRTETALVWNPLREAEAPRPLGDGRLEEGGAAADATLAERLFVLSPDAETSQLLWDAFQRGRVALSFGWTYHAMGVERGRGSLTATPGVLPADVDGPAPETPADHVVGSGAEAVEIAPGQLADRLRRIDLNQQVPPGFAALEVRCYDFDNALRPDLARKSVEVKAAALGGRTVQRAVTFRADAPAEAVLSVRFPQAVRLDRPFQWRTVEVSLAGEVVTSPWASRADWIPILDVTSPPSARPRPPPDPENLP
jgi:hypothetical protein